MERWGLWMEKWSNYTQKASAEDPWTWVEHLPWRREANGEWISISDFILFTVFFLCRLIEGSIVSGGGRGGLTSAPLSQTASSAPCAFAGWKKSFNKHTGSDEHAAARPPFSPFLPFFISASIHLSAPPRKKTVHECLFFNPLRGSGTTWPAPNMQRPT